MPERAPPRPHARLFLALWPDAAARAALVAWQHAWHWPPGVARVAPQRLHLTLHFIGDVDESRLDALGSALALPFEPFELAFGRPQQWHGGLALALPDTVPAGLLGLHARLGDALRAQRLPVETRAFRPHLTLARRAAGARPPAAPPCCRWTVSSYALVRSAGGYRTLREYRGDTGRPAPREGAS